MKVHILLDPDEYCKFIDCKHSDMDILDTSFNLKLKDVLLTIETSEETMTCLLLKYGSDSVWKR